MVAGRPYAWRPCHLPIRLPGLPPPPRPDSLGICCRTVAGLVGTWVLKPNETVVFAFGLGNMLPERFFFPLLDESSLGCKVGRSQDEDVTSASLVY